MSNRLDEADLTINDLPNITATELSTLLRSSLNNNKETKPLTSTDTLLTTTTTTTPSPNNNNNNAAPKKQQLAIIDVRDSDHIGGHIKTSQHVPSTSLDARMPELVRELQDVPVVVFHCALSQQRGPKAALRYLREREKVKVRGRKISGKDEREGVGAEGEENNKQKQQKVLVLERGFVGWQELYGEDNELTEAYVKDVWREWS